MSSRTRICSFELDPRGFVRATVDQGATFTVQDAREATEAVWSVAGQVRCPTLVDLRGILSKSREARMHFAGDEARRVCAAVALLVESPLSRMVANLFMVLSEQPVPTRSFNHEADAIDWLLGARDG